MNLQNKTLFAFTLSAIIALGALPLVTTDAFALARAQDDVNPPIFEGDDDSLVAFFEDEGFTLDPDGCLGLGPLGIDLVQFDDFSVSGPVYPSDPIPRIEQMGFDPTTFSNIWEIHMPNIEDDFDTKLMRIQVTSCVFGGGETSILDVTAEDLGSPAAVTFVDHVDDLAFTPFATYFYENYVIHPNPDFETITLAVPFETVLAQVVVDTISLNEVVGGELLPIESTALLLAGIQGSAIWMLPVLAGAAGAGIVAFKLRRK